MKKLFYLAAMVLGLVACSSDDNELTIRLDDFGPGLESDWESRIAEHRNFDPITAPDLFTGKTWILVYDSICDSNFNFQELWFSYLSSPILLIPPGGNHSEYDMEFCAEDDPERRWTYDPETKTIAVPKYISGIGRDIYHYFQLIALSEDLMACNYSFLDYNSGQTVYRQRVYVTEEVWGTLIANW